MALVAAVYRAAVSDIEDQDDELIVVDLVQDPPGTGPDPPCARVADELASLPRVGIFRKPVGNPLHLPLYGTIKPLECLAGVFAEDHFVGHWSQACISLDLLPRDERLTCVDAGTGLTSCGSIGEVLKQLS